MTPIFGWMVAASAAPAVTGGAIALDPPTPSALGLRWAITGDDDHYAVATLRYRVGKGKWRDGLPLFRVQPADVYGYPAEEELAGSLFDLDPATTYEIELTLVDPDGGGETRSVQATTRPLPADPVHPEPVDVSTADALRDALASADPGAVITLAPGVYQGPFAVYPDGTAENPIVLRGAARDSVVLDGGGCDECNVLEVYGSYVHVEQLTLQNANRGLRFQDRGAVGNVVRRVRIVDVALGIGAKEDQRDFWLCDNELEGPLRWPQVYSDDGGQHANTDGIVVMGSGHVVCHNTLTGWGDAIKIGQAGARAVDVIGNDVSASYDNGLEFDGASGNVRALRNRFTNTYATLSFQPVYGGPVYAARNLVVNVAHEQLKLHSLGGSQETSGILVLHNTFLSPGHALRLADDTTSHHFVVQGNLFVGPDGADPVVEWTGGIDDGTFEGDGWWPDGRFAFGDRTWDSFAEVQAEGLFEGAGVLLDDGTPLASGVAAPSSYEEVQDPTSPALDPTSAAVDAALVLPGITDGFRGDGPDLGAHELGCPEPVYGPRPDGVDALDDGGCAVDADPTADTGADAATTTAETAGPPADADPMGAVEEPAGCGCAAGALGHGSASPAGVFGVASALVVARVRRRRR